MARNQVKPNVLFKQLITIVSKYVESHDALIKELIDSDKGTYSLRNTEVPITMDGSPGFYLLKVKKTKGLFLHVSVTLKAPKRDASLDSIHDFEGISIQFLQGTGRLFCRAEWDVKKKKDKLEHPQPHWHWGGEKEEEKPQAFVPSATGAGQGSFMEALSTDEPSLPAIDFKELHYAMAAKWAAQDIAIEEFTQQQLYNWLKNCIANVIDQYNYQVNKGSFESSKAW